MTGLLGLVLPLGLDSFAVSFAVLGGGGLSRAQRLRIALLFLVFEAGMPLAGLALGAPLASAADGAARFIAPVALAAVGVWILRDGFSGDDDDDDDETARARGLLTARGWALLGLGLGISIDEVALGFAIGFTKLPVPEVTAAIVIQAGVAIWAGGYLGSRLRGKGAGHVSVWAERLAGAGLIALSAFLLLQAL